METTSTEIREKKKPRLSESEKRIKHIESLYTKQTDRSLLEEQTFLLQRSTESLLSIKKNVQFFFWITVIGMAIWFIVFFLAESELLDSNY